MALKAILESLDGIEESVHDHYTETEDGKFRLDVDSVTGWALEDVAGLKKSLATERKGNREGSSFRKKYERDGDMLDPDEAWNALDKLKELEENPPGDGDKDERLQKLTDQYSEKESKLLDKHRKEVEDLKKERDDIDRQLDKTIVDTAILAGINKHKGKERWIKPEARQFVKAVKGSDGKKVARVFGSDSEERITTKSGSQDPMSVEEYIGTLKDDPEFADAFDGSGASGSGATGADKTTGGTKINSKLPPTERLKQIRQQEKNK